MLDGAIFAGGVHGLKNNEQCFFIFCVKAILQLSHTGLIGSQQFNGFFFRSEFCSIFCIIILQAKLFFSFKAIILDVHKSASELFNNGG